MNATKLFPSTGKSMAFATEVLRNIIVIAILRPGFFCGTGQWNCSDMSWPDEFSQPSFSTHAGALCSQSSQHSLAPDSSATSTESRSGTGKVTSSALTAFCWVTEVCARGRCSSETGVGNLVLQVSTLPASVMEIRTAMAAPPECWAPWPPPGMTKPIRTQMARGTKACPRQQSQNKPSAKQRALPSHVLCSTLLPQTPEQVGGQWLSCPLPLCNSKDKAQR